MIAWNVVGYGYVDEIMGGELGGEEKSTRIMLGCRQFILPCSIKIDLPVYGRPYVQHSISVVL